MATLGDDCYFFCTSTCAKGAACPFRHVEYAKTCRIICQHWQMGGCLRPMCKFRHSDFALQLDTIDVPCYWELLPAGCAKKNCLYKHLKPRPFDDVVPAATGSVPVETSSVGTTPRNDVSTSQTFVQPVVTPIIIQNLAESEESNSSPMKRPPEATQEPKIPTLPKIQELEEPENNKLDEEKLSHPIQEQIVEKKMKKVTPRAKKVKQKIAVQKTPKKVAGKLKSKSMKNNKQPPKSVKMRLGKAPSPEPVIQSSSERSSSESESESDDSIENIQVKSVEAILREKALESMLRKRDTERKASTDKKVLPPADKKTPPRQQKSPPVAKNVKKQASTVKRGKHVPAPVESSSSSSEGEYSEEEEDAPKKSSEKSSSSSSNESSESSSNNSEEGTEEDSDDLDVRRVVVDLESEKAARKKAKASFLKKQKLNAANAQNSRNKEQVITRVPARKSNHMPLSALNKDNTRGRQQNKRHVNYDSDSDDMVSSRVTEPLKLSVRDRLGKSRTLHNSSSGTHQLSRHDKYGSSVGLSRAADTKKRNAPIATSKMFRSSSGSSSEDDSDSLADVKVKTLEEIRLEKMRKQSAEENRSLTSQVRVTEAHRPLPVKQRLGKIPTEKQDSDVDNMKGRQVVLVNDAGSKSDDASSLKVLDEQKKAKKRPWRSQKRNIDLSSVEVISGDGERTTVIASPHHEDDYAAELKSYKKVQIDEESPFEKLKRKALMRKLESSRMLKHPAPLDGGDADSETLKKAKIVGDDGADTKTHKHNHHHKHHRRIKVERQIYMPPGMKNTVPEPSQTHEPVSPRKEPLTAPAVKVSPLKRGPHPMAAAWAAGLSLSSKGGIARRPDPTPISAVNSGDPIVASRSAGLTLSSRGVTGRPMTATNSGNSIVAARSAGLSLSANAKKPEITAIPVVNSGIAGKLEIGNRLGIKEITKPKEIVSSIETSQPPLESLGVTIKSFSEIMAEKRKRRMEMLALKSGTTNDSVSSISSDTPSLPSSTSLPSISSELSPASSKKIDVGTRVPISPIVFASGKPPGSTAKNTVHSDSLTSSSLRITAQPTVSTTQKVSPAVPIFNVPPKVSSLPHNTTVTADKIKLKSVNNSKNNVVKTKKVKKLFLKKNSKEQIDSVTTKDSRNNVSHSSSHQCTATTIESETVPSIARVTSLESSSSPHNRACKASTDAVPSHQNLSHCKIPTSQAASLDVQTKASADKFSTKIDTPPAVKAVAASTRKYNISAPAVESEPIKKKTRLSIMEDEFNFFEDEDLSMDDGFNPEDIEPIDNLLQDIDDLLS